MHKKMVGPCFWWYIQLALGNGLVSLKTNYDASTGGSETKMCLNNKCSQFSKKKNGADHVVWKLLSRPVDAGLRPLLSKQRAHLISSPCLPARDGFVQKFQLCLLASNIISTLLFPA